MHTQKILFENSFKVLFFGNQGKNFAVKLLSPKLSGGFFECQSSKNNVHLLLSTKYPTVQHIPLPDNIQAIENAGHSRFSPQRTRDITGPAILSHQSASFKTHGPSLFISSAKDPHVESYDCRGAISLSSSMQTNVPDPFKSKGKATHWNMPGGQWEQENKFISEDMQNSHYINLKLSVRKQQELNGTQPKRLLSSKAAPDEQQIETKPVTTKDKLKRAFAEYGTTAVVFHVSISLISLGTCYLIVSSGLDVAALMTSMGLGDTALAGKIATNTGTFVAAYAIHKVFAPVRLSITLGAAPFIVRYLRNIGFLKTVKTSSP